MDKGVSVATLKPDFKTSMKQARIFCLSEIKPKITRSEIYHVYRSLKSGSCLFFRCYKTQLNKEISDESCKS